MNIQFEDGTTLEAIGGEYHIAPVESADVDGNRLFDPGDMQISTRPVIYIEMHCRSFAIAQWLDKRDGTESCRMKWVRDATDAENIGMLACRFIQENGWGYTPDIAYRVSPMKWIVTLR